MPCCDRVALPSLVPLSTEVLYPQGAYLMDNGRIFVLWLGREVSPQILEDVSITMACQKDRFAAVNSAEQTAPAQPVTKSQLHKRRAHLSAASC